MSEFNQRNSDGSDEFDSTIFHWLGGAVLGVGLVVLAYFVTLIFI